MRSGHGSALARPREHRRINGQYPVCFVWTEAGPRRLEEFLEPLEMTQTELAERIDVPFQSSSSRPAATPACGRAGRSAR